MCESSRLLFAEIVNWEDPFTGKTKRTPQFIDGLKDPLGSFSWIFFSDCGVYSYFFSRPILRGGIYGEKKEDSQNNPKTQIFSTIKKKKIVLIFFSVEFSAQLYFFQTFKYLNFLGISTPFLCKCLEFLSLFLAVSSFETMTNDEIILPSFVRTSSFPPTQIFFFWAGLMNVFFRETHHESSQRRLLSIEGGFGFNGADRKGYRDISLNSSEVK